MYFQIILTTSKVLNFCFAALASILFLIWITIRQILQVSTASPKERRNRKTDLRIPRSLFLMFLGHTLLLNPLHQQGWQKYSAQLLIKQMTTIGLQNLFLLENQALCLFLIFSLLQPYIKYRESLSGMKEAVQFTLNT